MLSNLYLRQIWDAVERQCLVAPRLIFCGNSLPDADVHVWYLLKRAEQVRQDSPEVFAVNQHNGKSDKSAREKIARYQRFIVNKANVHDTDVSFEKFAEDFAVIDDSRQ